MSCPSSSNLRPRHATNDREQCYHPERHIRRHCREGTHAGLRRCDSGDISTGRKRKKVGAIENPPMPPMIAPAKTPRMPADGYATSAFNVFDQIGVRDGWHDVTVDVVHLSDDNTVDIDQAAIDDYGYNELDGSVHDHGEEQDGAEEVDKALFD
ncbi:putative galacturonosyltransferase 14 [Hordeum vulgare]|nr:putative galacturonosyltransferase 14 [Hordeum vulgare]